MTTMEWMRIFLIFPILIFLNPCPNSVISSNCQISNLSEYYVGYHYYNVADRTFITDLCKYVYDQGINCDAGGEQQDFDVLYSEKTVDYGYVKVDIIYIDSYVTINDIKYRVRLQGQSTRNNLNFWYVHLNIYVM